MNLRVLCVSVVLICSALTNGTSAAVPVRPNILFIMVDDLGKDWISCYGAEGIQTPRIDALAAGGMKFRNAWSMPQCTPTRVTLLTGQYPWRTGWVNHWDVPRWGVGYFDWRRYTTFANVLSAAGYATCIVGKWQINDFRVEPEALKKHGFDDWCVWTGGEGGNPPSDRRYWDPYIHTKAGSKTHSGKFGPDIYCDHLIGFMRENRARPMMLYFPMALTHGPFTTTPTEPKAQGKLPKHKAMVRYTDHLVGRLVDELDKLKLRERTIIIFTTDNGSGGSVLGTVGGKKPSGGKATKYEGGICEPFIVNCPGTVPTGVETDALTDFSDLFPTFVDLAKAQLPAGLEIDGRSFAPLILGQATDSARDWIMALGHGVAATDEQGIRGVHDYSERVMRDKRYKVWVDTNRNITQLYDLKLDPLERTNLLKENRPELSAALQKFSAVIKEMPQQDARPRYTPRGPLPWDTPHPQISPQRSRRKAEKK